MVSFSDERLHICQGFCEKCLEKVENHLDDSNDVLDIMCEDCERCFPNEFCFESHKVKKLFGEYQTYCDFLVTLKNCDSCVKNFKLNLKCRHFGIKKKATVDDNGEENVLIGRVYSVGAQRKQEYVKCGFCSDFYLKGNSSHSCFLKSTDSILVNSSRRSSTIKSQNVFYYDIESRLENYFECKVESPEMLDSYGKVICQKRQLEKTQYFHDEIEVNEFRDSLSKDESKFLTVSKCQSHQPMLLCVVNELHSVKRDFCERDLNSGDPIASFFRWIVDDVVKPMNSNKNKKNDYVFVAHNGSLYDTQYIYKGAHNFFGYRNVNVLLHMNRMIELRIQIHTGFRLSSVFFKDSYKFINLPLRLLPISFGFNNELQKGFFPHLLNTLSNMNYTSHTLPELKYFGIDQMNEDEKRRLMQWYNDENQKLILPGEVYDLRNEMKKYCYDDCYVLSTTFSHFNESMMNELLRSNVKDIVPHQFTILADFVTLLELVIHWYIGTSMSQRTLAVVPHGGYNSGKCGSLKERVWLMYLDKLHKKAEGVNFIPIRFRYCTGKKQKKVGNYYLDRFRIMNNGRRECFEFYGCYYHGCPSCFPDRSKIVRYKYRENGYQTVDKMYTDTISREVEIKNVLGFEEGFNKWVTIWEHDYNDNEKVYRSHLNDEVNYGLVDKLNPRDSVKDGRTDVFRMYCRTEDHENQCIQHLDVNSLYPYVRSIVDFPLGHPEIRRGDHSCRDLLDKLK